MIFVTLVFAMALGAVALDTFLPALPQLVIAYDTTPSVMQNLISMYFVVSGLMQIVYGPLTDRFGRKSVLLVGVGIFVLGSVVVLTSKGIAMLMVGRFFQGLGAACLPVVTRTIVMDRYGADATQRMTYLMAAFALGPIVAPSIGTVSLDLIGLQGPFWFMLAYAVVVMVLVAWCIPETLKQPTSLKLSVLWQNLITISSHTLSVLYSILAGLIFGTIFIFLSMSSYVYIDIYGLSTWQYALVFASGASMFMLGSLLKGRFWGNLSEVGHLKTIAWLYGFCMLGIVVIYRIDAPLVSVVAMNWFISLIINVGFAFAQMMPMSFFPQTRGLASSVSGLIASVTSALIGWAALAVYDQSVNPLLWSVFGVCGLVVVVALVLLKLRSRSMV